MAKEEKTPDVQMGFSFEDLTDRFQVDGKKEKRNKQGGLVEGKQYRWALADARNIDSMEKHFGWAKCTDPDVAAPYGDQDSKGTTPHYKNAGEEFILMERPHTIMRAEDERDRKIRKDSMETEHKFPEGLGISTKTMIKRQIEHVRSGR